MRCVACNRALCDTEASAKNHHGEYYDLCSDCMCKSGVKIVESIVDGDDIIEDFTVEYDHDGEQELIEELVGRNYSEDWN